jgi:non-heme chloroperoxidase
MNSTATREVSLDYAVQGRRPGIPVLLLHGFTDSRRSFDRIMPRLPDSIYSVAVSQRGHGNSDRPDAGYAPHVFAADIAALMDRLELPGAVIVGHSMGASVAQRFAIDFPERTRGLALVASFFTLKNHAGVQDFWDSAVSTLEDPVSLELVRSFQLSTMAKSVPAPFLDMVVRESLKVPARVWRATLRALMDADLTRELGNIQAPTMLLWGDQDVFVSRSEQDSLLAAIPGSRLSIYPGIGHAPHWEDPKRFAAEIGDFVLREIKHGFQTWSGPPGTARALT